MSLIKMQHKKLTAREWRLLRMISEGVAPADISQSLYISVKTVSQHMSNIQRKLGVKNRLFLQKLLVTIHQQTDPKSFH